VDFLSRRRQLPWRHVTITVPRFILSLLIIDVVAAIIAPPWERLSFRLDPHWLN
jgi:hypothetical protein